MSVIELVHSPCVRTKRGLKMRVSGLALIAGAAATAVEAGGPMAKVINLLDSMTAEIKKEMEEQGKISKKLQCWAATMKKEKETAIAANEALVGTKEQEVKKLTAQNAADAVKIKGLEKGIVFAQRCMGRVERNSVIEIA